MSSRPVARERRPGRAFRGFTLIELLVVVAIIAMLIGLLAPALLGAREYARRARARAEVHQVEMAYKAVLTDYRTWALAMVPGGAAGVTKIDLTQVQYLTGQTAGGNPRGVMYMEFDKGSTNSTGYLDPWKSVYQVKLDDNYDNQVVAGVHGAIPRNVAVWSKGKRNGLVNSGTTDDPIDDIKSWQQ